MVCVYMKYKYVCYKMLLGHKAFTVHMLYFKKLPFLCQACLPDCSALSCNSNIIVLTSYTTKADCTTPHPHWWWHECQCRRYQVWKKNQEADTAFHFSTRDGNLPAGGGVDGFWREEGKEEKATVCLCVTFLISKEIMQHKICFIIYSWGA